MKGLRAKVNSLPLTDLGAGLRALQAASAQRAVLDRLDVSLVLFEDVLINTATGEYRQVVREGGVPLPDAVAAAAATLLAGKLPQPTILLLLPTSHFISTHYHLNVSGEKVLRSALALQAHTMIPAYDEPLLLGLAGSQGTGVALWYPVAAADALYSSFAERGLLLGAFMPRTLALVEEGDVGEPQVMQDIDSMHRTHACWQENTLSACLTVSQRDLSQHVFLEQWEHEVERAGGVPSRTTNARNDWTGLRRRITPWWGYCFIPSQAEVEGRRAIYRKQQRLAGIAAMVVLALMCLPFLNNAVRKVMLERELDSWLQQSSAARDSQAAVIAMENEWGAVLEYPRQDVGGILLVLNSAIDNALSSFTLNKGVVDISGFAQDPALLIEQLTEREEFHDVGQSRSSAGASGERGDRFGIRMNVSGVDFPGYEARYPVTQEP